MAQTRWPIGVFTSIDSGLGVQFPVVVDLQIPTIQLHAPSRAGRTPEAATEFSDRLSDHNIDLTCVFAGFEGESYADIPTVEETVGLVPEATRASRLKELQEISDFCCLLGCGAIGLHVGMIPEARSGLAYKDLITAMRTICDHATANVQGVHLETGQETAETLLKFIEDVDRENLYINFDPANMILYGTGEPLEALEKVGKYVRSVHCKDGLWSDQPGVTWGREVRLGDGDVNIEKYLQMLSKIGYEGPLTIEREIPHDPEKQREEIAHARDLLVRLSGQLAETA